MGEGREGVSINDAPQVKPPSSQQVIDYLDTPPKRYDMDGDGYPIEKPQGEWVKFQDMDNYMLEGGGYMRVLLAERQELERLQVHLSSGGRDPTEKCYSKRDVEALIAVVIAARAAKVKP